MCNKWTLLHHAAKAGNVDILRLLMQNGAIVDAVDALGNTAAHYACLKGNSAAAIALCESGADLTVNEVSMRVYFHMRTVYWIVWKCLDIFFV